MVCIEMHKDIWLPDVLDQVHRLLRGIDEIGLLAVHRLESDLDAQASRIARYRFEALRYRDVVFLVRPPARRRTRGG